MNVLDILFALQEIPKRYEKSKNFDKIEKTKLHKVYISPMSHPWKHASFMAFLSKQKHRQESYQ